MNFMSNFILKSFIFWHLHSDASRPKLVSFIDWFAHFCLWSSPRYTHYHLCISHIVPCIFSRAAALVCLYHPDFDPCVLMVQVHIWDHYQKLKNKKLTNRNETLEEAQLLMDQEVSCFFSCTPFFAETFEGSCYAQQQHGSCSWSAVACHLFIGE